MGRHWKPEQRARWLSPEDYAALSPAEKKRLWAERQASVGKHGRQKGGPWPILGAAIGIGLAVGFTPNIHLPQFAQPSSAPVRTQFGSCKWGGGTDCVVDGDTFWIGGQKVRIAGIDAPETHDYGCESELALGSQAAERLQALLNSGAVTMTAIDRDRDVYGRLLRNVAVDGNDVGETLISEGLAREYAGGRRPWC